MRVVYVIEHMQVAPERQLLKAGYPPAPLVGGAMPRFGLQVNCFYEISSRPIIV
jgi:hypothetical protein